MGATRSAAAVANSPLRSQVTLGPKQKQRIVSIAQRQGISPSEVILRSLDLYEQDHQEQDHHEQDNAQAEELIHQMQTALESSLATLKEARHSIDESNRLILHYRQHPELLELEG